MVSRRLFAVAAPSAVGLIVGLFLVRVIYYSSATMEVTPWTLGETVPAPNDSTVPIQVVHPCPPNGPPRPDGGEYAGKVELEIEETAETVTIVARAPVPRGVACNFSLHYLDVTVVLDEQLGSRTLRGADARF